MPANATPANPPPGPGCSLYALLVGNLVELGDHEEAREVCRQGLAHFPDDPELLFRRGLLCHHFGDLEAAERAYLAVLEAGGRGKSRERHFSSIDRGIGSFKTRHNLAVVYSDAGRPDLAEEQWRRVTTEVPRYRAGWRGLIQCLLSCGKLDTAEGEIRRMGAQPHLRAEALTLAADVAKARGDLPAARRLLGRATDQFPTNADALGAWCQFLFEHDSPEEAAAALERLVLLSPGEETPVVR